MTNADPFADAFPTPPTPDELADRDCFIAWARTSVIALARWAEGAAPPDPKYDAIVSAGESAQAAKDMRSPKSSGCGLVVRGFWRMLGLVDNDHAIDNRSDSLRPPYHPGMVLADLSRMAIRAGAWRDARSSISELAPGDVVWFAPTAEINSEHVSTFLGRMNVAANGFDLVTMDGGQTGNAIVERTRHVAGVVADGRTIKRTIDLGALALRFYPGAPL